MELLYYEDQYKKEIEAKVEKIEGNKVLLDKTILIAASNTEPGDMGKINGARISGSKKEGAEVWHIMEKLPSFTVGDTVKVELDWDKRLKAIKLHSALHLLAGPFDRDMGKRPVAGAIRGNEAYLIFKEDISDELVAKAIEQANQDIENGLEIKSYWDETRQGFRWTQVGDYLAIPDGGLHVKSTKEIGKITLVKKEQENDKCKIRITIS